MKNILTTSYLDKLGTTFVHLGIHEKYNVNFEDYVFLVRHDLWEEFRRHRLGIPKEVINYASHV